MKRSLTLFFLLVFFSSSLVLPLLARAETTTTVLVEIVKIGDPLEARIAVKTPEHNYTCTGFIPRNLYYRETRAISKTLVVLPLYYLLDKVCPRLIGEITSLKGNIALEVRAPQNYSVYTSMDLRGYGARGKYTLPAEKIARYYLYDSIIVAGREYRATLVNKTLIAIYPADTPLELVKAASLSAIAVKKLLSSKLGPSPRSPVVLVLAKPREHPYTPQYHYSTGSVIYISLPEPPLTETNTLEIIHAAAHEAVHGWINHGLLWGTDYLVSEGTTEYLALLALYKLSPQVLKEVDSKIASLYITAKSKYGLGLLANAGLRQAALQLCGKDAYLEALKTLYLEALSKPLQALNPVSYTDLVEETANHCINETTKIVLKTVASILLIETLSGKLGKPEWPYVEREDINKALQLLKTACSQLTRKTKTSNTPTNTRKTSIKTQVETNENNYKTTSPQPRTVLESKTIVEKNEDSDTKLLALTPVAILAALIGAHALLNKRRIKTEQDKG